MDLAFRILAGERRAIARGISMVEDSDPQARDLLQALYAHTGKAHLIGVTGPPGTGKSTLVNGLAKTYRRRGFTVGIVAVDPTSPFSGGALLGDRIRMQELSGDKGVFIRSMASRGSLGGMARTTAEAIQILDAAGYERILVETVGAGQAEVDIAQTVHTVIVVQIPGMGDEIQAVKAGLLEIANILVVNKADREGAEQVVATLEAVLGLPSPASGNGERWRPPVLKTVATRGEGIAQVLEAIEQHASYLREAGLWSRREQARANSGLKRLVQEALWEGLVRRMPEGEWETLVAQLANRELDPYRALERLLARIGESERT